MNNNSCFISQKNTIQETFSNDEISEETRHEKNNDIDTKENKYNHYII